MIIELSWYEPEGGRQCIGFSDLTEAAEHYRIDCVECWYTKVHWTAEEVLQHGFDADWLEQRFKIAPKLLPLPPPEEMNRRWFEAIYLQYRCLGDTEAKALLGVGYYLRLYGAEPRPTQIVAELGPKITAEEEADALE